MSSNDSKLEKGIAKKIADLSFPLIKISFNFKSDKNQK